jgi:hypothetical protein
MKVYRETCTVTHNVPYRVEKGSLKGARSSAGILSPGRVVWIQKPLEKGTLEHCVPAYAEGIGIISVDSRFLVPSRVSEVGPQQFVYWGIECRTCHLPVVLGFRPSHNYGSGSATVRPGTYKCSEGHRHAFFSDDLRFFSFADAVGDAVLQENRASYESIYQRLKAVSI